MRKNAPVVSLSSLRPLCEALTTETAEYFAEETEGMMMNVPMSLLTEVTLNFEP